MDRLLSLTGTEPTPFHKSFSKVAGLQIHDTTPGCKDPEHVKKRICQKEGKIAYLHQEYL